MVTVNIDVEYLLLVAGQDRKMVLTLVDDFKIESLDIIQAIKNSIDSEIDLEVIGGMLHKFRGASGSLGMVSLSKLIIELETWTEDQWLEDDRGLRILSECLSQSVTRCKRALS